MTKDEALKLALEALEQIKQETFHPAKVFDHNHAITAIREALAQPAQEPVAWIVDVGEMQLSWNKPSRSKSIPLYTAPTQQKEKT